MDNLEPVVSLGPGMFGYPEIYSRDGRGDLRFWFIEADETNAKFRVVHGKVNGEQPAVSEWKKVQPKNMGRANETTPVEQLHSEIRSLYKIKLRKGYSLRADQVDAHTLIKPMLAQDFSKNMHLIDGTKTIFVQPKLDGIRCLASASGLWSRTGKRIVSVPHIEEALRPVFEQHPDLVLDGELYNHDLRDNFQRLTSLVRRTKLAEADFEETSVLEYHVYDCVIEGGFPDRFRVAQTVTEGCPDIVQAVATYQFWPAGTNPESDQMEAIDDIHRKMTQVGYEGTVIRFPGFPYEHKRSKSLLKYKDFDTEEFEVISVHEGEGNWSGAIKRFGLILPDESAFFGAGVRGTRESLEALLVLGEVPKWATVRYFGKSKDGIPRFPVAIDYGFENERGD